MFPTLSIYNAGYSFNRDAKLAGHGDVVMTSLPAQRSNFKNLLGLQLGSGLSFASTRAAFLYHVVQIPGLAILKQMGRIAARRPVAFMANMKCRPSASSEKESHAMRVKPSRLKISLLLKGSVSTYKRARPLPTRTLRAKAWGFVDLVPEARYLLRGKLGWVYSNVSHDLNLTHRFGLRSGSFRDSRLCASRLYFNTAGAIQ
jgi:hypothetical protein